MRTGFAGLTQAHPLLERTTDAAEPHLPPHALDRDEPQRRWRESVGDNTANDYTWDESYTLPENLYLAWERGAGDRYRKLAPRFLLDKTYFDPLSENKNVLPRHHAYSFCNALSSAMQAYLADGSRKHLRAASNAFDMITGTQSFATGGWGPERKLRRSGEWRALCQPWWYASRIRNALRQLRAFQTDSLPAASDARRPLRRQHGARPVQHRARRQAVAARRPRLLLLRLSFLGQQARSTFPTRGRAAPAPCRK